MSLPVTTRPAHNSDLPEISRLHARTLGPGRFARSAYRVREGTAPVTRFCRVAVLGDKIIAALRMTEVTVGKSEGVLMLGPLAVAPEFAGRGYGRQLVTETIETARSAGLSLILLVGDEPYYGRFGFKPVPMGQVALPGPVNPMRLLAAELTPGALARYRGLVEAAR